MTLIDEREVLYEQEKKQKIFKTLIAVVVILIIIAVMLWVFIKTRNYRKLKVYVDGKQIVDFDEGLLLKDEKGKTLENNGQIYISVKKLSTLLGRQYYNSEYKKKGEDKTKCQVRDENEYTSFVANSNNIYKAIITENDELAENKNNSNSNGNSISQDFEIIPEKNTVEYEYFSVDDGVKYINDEFYVNIETANLGFNTIISYDSKKKTIKISTAEYLEALAKKSRNDVVNSSEYNFVNKRLLKYGMCIVKDEDGNFGVGSFSDKNKLSSYVASCKYSSIKFNEAAKTLTVVTSNDNKDGILYLNLNSQEVEKNMASQYDEIKCIDNNFEYFLVKSQDKYGIIDSSGKIILNTAFEQIGIDDGLYTDITNKYILNNKYIPVKQNGLWGLYGRDGSKLIDPQFQNFGCTLAQSGESVAVIPNITETADGIVFLYNKEQSLYGVYSSENGEKVAISLIEVFKKEEAGNEKYYINHVISRENAVVHTLDVHKDL